MNKQSGITLLEILVGVTIFAVCLSVAAGVFSQTTKFQKKAEVSRVIDHDVRSGSAMIASDIRNSRGVVAVTGSPDNRIYYNFAGYNSANARHDHVPILDSSRAINVLRISIDSNHRRQYYLSNNRLVAQDLNLNDRGQWVAASAQPITGENIEINNLKFYLKTASESRNVSNFSVAGDDYPWVRVSFQARYVDPRDRAELRGEEIEIDTVISPRNYSFIN